MNNDQMVFKLQLGGYYTHKSSRDGEYVVWRMLNFTPNRWDFMATQERFDQKPTFEDALAATVAKKGHHQVQPGFILDKEDLTLLGHKPFSRDDFALGLYLADVGGDFYPDQGDNEASEKIASALISRSQQSPLLVKIVLNPNHEPQDWDDGQVYRYHEQPNKFVTITSV
jgi:hypothetical protein